jgi:hypothetical protein
MTESKVPHETDEAERRFAEDLAARGEAVPQDTESLPPGATHEIEEEQPRCAAAASRLTDPRYWTRKRERRDRSATVLRAFASGHEL